jgi:phytoene dehydrogenase-like protein
MDLPDAVVVGAGPNGLTAAVALAREGLRVQVLERADEVGGAVRSAEATLPGLVHDLGSAVHPFAVGSPALGRWPLERYGLRWVRPPLPLAHPLPDAPAARLEASVVSTAAGLGTAGDGWRTLTGPATDGWPTLAPAFLGPLLRPPSAPVALARFGPRALPPATWTARLLPSTSARALWAGLAAHASLPLSALGTSAVALTLAALGQRVGWPFPAGGAGALARALRGYLEDLGGEVRTGVEVRDLDDLPPARAALLDLTPAQLLRIAQGRLPDRYERALRRYRPGEAVVKLDLAVEGGVPWRDPACAEAGTVHLGGTFEQIADAEHEVARGRLPTSPYVLLAQAGRFDASRRSGDLEPVWAYAHLPRALRDDAEAVRTLAERTRAQIERAAPGTRTRTRAMRTWGPAELAASNPNLAGGDISAGAATLRQLLARPVLSPTPYATPLAGIYLCSAATPPGPGVHGMCGFRAAQAAAWRAFGTRIELPGPAEPAGAGAH